LRQVNRGEALESGRMFQSVGHLGVCRRAIGKRATQHDQFAALQTSEHAYDPTDRSATSSLRPTRRYRAVRRVAIASLAAMAGVLTFAVLTDGGSQMRTPQAFHGDLEQLAIAAGFGINQVSLSGHRYPLEDDIFDALDLNNMHSFLSFEPTVLRARLERLSWIKTIEVSRVYPGQLQIRVTERTPTAIWQRGGQSYLIDDGGRVLAAIEPGVMKDLPRIAGEGATRDIGQIFALLQQFPEVARFVSVSERIGERRWTLQLAGGGSVHLPVGQESAALQGFLSQDGALTLIQRGTSIVDLRATGRITVRPATKGTRVSTRGRRLG